jgi:hypothetical protein
MYLFYFYVSRYRADVLHGVLRRAGGIVLHLYGRAVPHYKL